MVMMDVLMIKRGSGVEVRCEVGSGYGKSGAGLHQGACYVELEDLTLYMYMQYQISLNVYLP
jgi:hypothetical protein